MAKRKIILANEEIYHSFNRSVAKEPIFNNSRDYSRILELINFYRFKKCPVRFSHFQRLTPETKKEMLNNLNKSGEINVEIYSFTVMPNHFHILLKQKNESGIKNFLSQIQNSYAKYYNTKFKRSGSLFQEMFKAVRLEDDEQFVHICRYIHLNPMTSYILKNSEELLTYPWNSFSDYAGFTSHPFLSRDLLLSFYPKKTDLLKFTLNQLDFQRKLNKIKHLTFEH